MLLMMIKMILVQGPVCVCIISLGVDTYRWNGPANDQIRNID